MDKNDYIIHQSGIFKYKVIGYDRLGDGKCFCINMVEEESEEELPVNNMSTFGLNSFSMKTIKAEIGEYQLKKDNIKTINVKDIINLYEDVINFYYDNCFNNTKEKIYEERKSMFIIDKNEDDNKVFAKIVNLSNLMYSNSRIGPSNLCILPQSVYDKIGNRNFNSMKLIINPTSLHNDKIFVIRLSNSTTEGGVSVFTDTNVQCERENKIVNIMKKLNKPIKERLLSYNITGLGNVYKYTMGVLYLNE